MSHTFNVIQGSDNYEATGSDYIEIDSSEIASLCAFEVDCRECNGTGRTDKKKCDECEDGVVLTPLGEQLLDFLKRRLKLQVGGLR